MRTRLPIGATLAYLLVLPLTNCVCQFGSPDAGNGDGGTALDSALPTDAAGHDITGRDLYVPPTDAAGRDLYQPPRDAARPDTYRPPYDANFNPDVVGIDAVNYLPLGADCTTASLPCIPGTTCLGESGAYFCRKDCTLNGTDCNLENEYCTPWRREDGGAYVSPGGCFPASGPGEECSPENCAQIYTCVAPSGSQDYRCRPYCTPGSTDAGCPVEAPRCLSINGWDGGGACLPN